MNRTMLYFLLFFVPLMFVYVYAFRSQAGVRRSRTKIARSLGVTSLLNHQEQAVSTLHVIVLVHGWLGNPKEMGYLKQSLYRHVLECGGGGACTNVTTLEAPNPTVVDFSKRANRQVFVIHSAEANSGLVLTSDGIAAGGQRVAKEIDQLVSHYKKQTGANTKVTLSLVGNSLGGLYCRYAVSDIQALKEGTAVPKFFVTTCTPHLGVSQHTFLTIPKWVESPIARVMQQTGLDLFRRTSIIQDMAMQSRFVNPILSFQRRIAYANVYGTDFQVPTATAAFWAPTDSIHYKAKVRQDNNVNYFDKSNILLQLFTPQQREKMQLDNSDTSAGNNQLSARVLSTQLDLMGWTKVLIDLRHHLPLSFGRRYHREETAQLDSSTWTAEQLLQEFDRGRFRSFPLGHTVLVANSKDFLNQYLTQGGKSTMDYLASTMIQELIAETKSRDQPENSSWQTQ